MGEIALIRVQSLQSLCPVTIISSPLQHPELRQPGQPGQPGQKKQTNKPPA